MKNRISIRISLLSALFIAICVISGFLFQGCAKDAIQKTNDTGLDTVMANSPEFEDAIIAASDLHQSLVAFKTDLREFNLSHPKAVDGPNGTKIVNIPGMENIMGKIRTFNEKKKLLLKEYPQFSTLPATIRKDYFKNCMQNSMKVSSELLRMGVNIYQPATRSPTGAESYFDDQDDLTDFLDNLMSDPDCYVEVQVIFFADGTYATFINDVATVDDTTMVLYQKDGGYVFPDENGVNKEVIGVGHTQAYGSDDTVPSDTDKDNKYPGIANYIYYGNGFVAY